MRAPGRPKGEYRSAKRAGTPVNAKGCPEREYRSAQHEGTTVSSAGRPDDAEPVGPASAGRSGRLKSAPQAMAHTADARRFPGTTVMEAA
jgi:hypothetical protein